MNLLLDTQAFIWFVEDDNRLSKVAKLKLEDRKNLLFIRIASLWEMSIKVSLGKLKLSGDIKSIMKWVHLDIGVMTQFAEVPVHIENFKDKDEMIKEKSYLAFGIKSVFG